MSKWESLQLNKIAGLVMGQSPSSDSYNTEGEGMPFFQGKSDFGKVNPKIRMYCKSPKKLAHKNDILLSVRAPVGDVNIAEGTCCIGRGLAAISGQKEKSYSKYIYYYLLWKKKELENIGVGSTFKAIGKKDIEKILIPLPPLDIQKKIATALDTANALIEKRKEQIEKLDLLIKSQFIEMFGDPVTNPKGWEKKQLSKLIVHANNGMARRGNDIDGDIVLRLVELQDGFLDYSKPNRILLSEFEKKRYLLFKNDFLFARVNGNPDYVGRCAVFHDIGEDVYYNDHIIRVRFDDSQLQGFVSTLLNSQYGKRQMRSKIKTSAGQYTISQDGIGAIEIICPPLSLQTQFAKFVEKVEAQKALLQKSLADMEQNYQSFMQKCFKGEIF